jgi:biopolymer transport protein TolQ
MTSSISILLKAYLDSDFFGKGIFISLFLLSTLSWVVIIYKSLIYKKIKQQMTKDKEVIENLSDGILNLSSFEPVSEFEPYKNLYSRMQEKAFKILEKNQYFAKDKQQAIFLNKDDLALISVDLEAGIAKEMKKVENGLFILNSSVSLAPFLGILGTVWGILISLFEMQKGASFSNTVIIQGLSTALATTVIGLLIAIPALIGYAYLKSVAKSVYIDLGVYSQELVSKLELQYKKVD